MSRRRTSNGHLPKRVYLDHGAYYYIESPSKKIWLGRDFLPAMEKYKALVEENGGTILLGDPYVASRLYRAAKASAKARGIDFSITLQEVRDLLDRAGGRCELTGLHFSMETVSGARRRPYAPSLDRIDGRSGYQKDNLRVICAALNIAISDFGLPVLMTLARRLGKNIPQRNISGGLR